MHVVGKRIPRWIARAQDAMCRPGAGWGLAGRRSMKAGGSAIVLLSAAVVSSMVASVAMGPIGDQVLARDGYSNRDLYASNLVGAILGRMPAPTYAPPLQASAERVRPRPARGALFTRRPDARGTMRRAAAPAATRVTFASAKTSMCVRLCDGYFFPVGNLRSESDLKTQATVCSNACPGAPTRLYTLPSEGGDIGGAISVTNGQPYTALPVAYAHNTEVGPTCACHAPGEAVADAVAPLKDITMRKGDSVMTPVGWRVFRGATHWPLNRSDFSTLKAAPSLSRKTRSTMTAMENATLSRSPARRVRAADLNVRVSVKATEPGPTPH